MTEHQRVTIDELRAWGAEKNMDELWPEVLADARRQWASAGNAVSWVNTLPTAVRRKLVGASVLCPGNTTLLTVYWLPTTNAAVADAHGHRLLVVPSRRARMEGRNHSGAPWWVVSAQDTWTMRCRCHNMLMTLHSADLWSGRTHANFTVVLR